MKLLKKLDRSLAIFTKTWRYLKISKDPAQDITYLKHQWADEILEHLNIELKVVGSISTQRPLIFVGNHISYLDILILLKLCPDLSFVAKQEVRRWPAIGAAAERVNTIFVNRENKGARRDVKNTLIQALLKQKKAIAIFPSGTTCMQESKEWKRGAFEIAREAQVLVQPFRLNYTPLRDVAYIDQDTFFTHLMNLSSLPQITAEIEFHQPIHIQDSMKDKAYWQKWTQERLEKSAIL